ncbi:hypothetical protein UZ36_04325 [Candidatus Nitromaritima sp. SCGC AAA799-C22]|nr:hypothetical protein UZ36_04325 [Candidatus Nitromaritima sp. SCGC AAA799-C22]
MSVIFIVLTILIVTIKLMARLMPYEAPPASAATTQTSAAGSASGISPTLIAVITTAMATHLGKSPSEFHITKINPRQ